MAKLEELTELLVSEIREFEEAVKRLEEIQRKKVSLDVTELGETFDKQERILLQFLEETGNNFKRMENTIEKAKIYTKWAVIVFLLSIALNCIGAAILLLS